MSQPPPPASALLPGEFVNLGDAMLSLAAARRVAQQGGRVAVLPYRRPADAVRDEFEREGFEVITMRDEPLRAFRACAKGAIWIGGGHAIRSEVSLGWLLFATLAAWWGRLTGRTVRVVGAGASSVKAGWRRWLFAGILGACDKVFVRDPISAKTLSAEFPGQAPKVQLAADLAFLKGCLDFSPDQMDEACCLVSPGIDVREGRAEDPAEILGALRTLHERFGMRHVIVVPHDARTEYGLDFCKALESTIKDALPVSVEVVAKGGIEHGLMAPYRRARWIITGRLHGLIIGAQLGRSVIYTPGSAGKLRPFAELFAYEMTSSDADHAGKFTSARDVIALAVRRQRIAAELNFNDAS